MACSAGLHGNAIRTVLVLQAAGTGDAARAGQDGALHRLRRTGGSSILASKMEAGVATDPDGDRSRGHCFSLWGDGRVSPEVCAVPVLRLRRLGGGYNWRRFRRGACICSGLCSDKGGQTNWVTLKIKVLKS